MTTLSLTKTSITDVKADAIVVGITKGANGPELAAGNGDLVKAFKKRLVPSLTALGATGRIGEVTRLATLGATSAPTLVAVGLGEAPDPDALRRGAGAALRELAGTSRVATNLAAGGVLPEVRAVAEGALLGAYAFNRYRSAASSDTTKAAVGSVALVVPNARDKEGKAELERAVLIGEAVALCRDLVNTPPGDLRPADFAQAAVDACKAVGCKVEVLDEKALVDGGFGGILGVGAGSSHPPRLVRIEYGGKSTPAIHLVGKGITFDSGGLSLKPAQAMEWMKSDMGGAAAIISAMRVLAQRQPDVHVVAWLPMAENMPSGQAIRPSDVLTMRGGKTVEVLNTDAEGRLILADAIVRAGEENPDYIVDVATLTGAQLVALGAHVFAVMGNDDEFRQSVVDAATAAGELAWPMPLPPELRKSLDSQVADIANMGDRYGGMLVAGLFLQDFVPDGVKWAHLDIAGPSFNQGDPHGYTPKGGTGVAVRTLVELVERLAG